MKSSQRLLLGLVYAGLVTLLILSQCSRALPAETQESPQWQIWQSETFEIPLTTRLSAELRNESRYQAGGLYYQAEELRMLQQLSKKADLELGWQHVEDKNGSLWQAQNYYFGGLILKGRLGSLVLSDRNRFEYCAFSYDSPSYLRYRNRLELAFPGKIRPYVADELFFDFGGQIPGLNRNRLYAGVKGELGPSVLLDLYLMRQTSAKVLDEGEVYQRFNTAGGALKIRF